MLSYISKNQPVPDSKIRSDGIEHYTNILSEVNRPREAELVLFYSNTYSMIV